MISPSNVASADCLGALAPILPPCAGPAPELRFTLEAIGHALPHGVMILDGDLRIVFANAEAAQVVALWRGGPEGAARYKPSAWLAVPPEVAKACADLWSERIGWQARPSCGRGPHGTRRREVRHPQRPSLCAVVSLYRSSFDPAIVRFCVLLHEDVGDAFPRRRDGASLARWHGHALLTPAERRVAALVAAGYSNRDVAGELGRSPTTIKCQLGAIFRKLQVETRTQLAVRFRTDRD